MRVDAVDGQGMSSPGDSHNSFVGAQYLMTYLVVLDCQLHEVRPNLSMQLLQTTRYNV